MLRKELYTLEGERRTALIEGDRARQLRVEDEMHAVLSKYSIVESPDSGAFKYVQNAHISKDMILAVSRCDRSDLCHPVEGLIDACRKFVSEELRVNLADVTVVRVQDDYVLHEGRAFSCRDTEHVVVLAPDDGGFVSPDILVHELGHAAEFSLRRAKDDDRLLYHHRIFSEAVAHYCQYNYLLRFGTREDRLGAVGSLTKEYLALCAVLASIELKQSHMVPATVVRHEVLSDFVDVYGVDSILRILAGYRGQSLGDIYYSYIEPRYGAILALRLLDDADAIRQLALACREQPVPETLAAMGIAVDSLFEFDSIDDLLWKFVGE